MRSKLFVVLPAYNEEEAIVKLLGRIEEAMDDNEITNYQVIVVNDGSHDKTAELVAEKAKEMPIEMLTHEINQGLGATIRDGLEYAGRISGTKDVVITLDADDTHTPGLIMRMIRGIQEGHDVVIASRYREGSRVVGLSLYRVFLSYGASWMFRIFFNTPGVRDFTCGFRAYRASALKDAMKVYKEKFIDQEGFQCMVDIILKLRKLDLIFGEVPFVLRYDLKGGASKMKVYKTIKNTLKLMWVRWFE